jgi:hypothetical protein
VTERADQTLAPVVVTLAAERTHEDAARVGQHRDEHHHADQLASDRDTLLAEVDLQLVARRRLEPHGRQLGRAPIATMTLDDALHVAHVHVDAALREHLRYHDRVALRGRVEQAHHLGALIGRELSARRSRLHLGVDAAPQVPAHRPAAHPGLPRDAAQGPLQRVQGSDLTHDLWVDHHHLGRPWRLVAQTL